MASDKEYSDRYQSVYTKPDDNLHWLVAIPHDNNRLEIHQTDEHGVIITRDTYESNHDGKNTERAGSTQDTDC